LSAHSAAVFSSEHESPARAPRAAMKRPRR
jgi:hypothetical protein